MKSANTILIINAIEAGLRATQELTTLLQKAKAEDRDVTDEEIAALQAGNDVLSIALITRLRGGG